MDNSLIPRAFSPTDAKRRAEEQAREAERRTSARNTSAASIPQGGKVTFDAGATMKLVGIDYDSNGTPYETSGQLGTEAEDIGYGRIRRAPGFYFTEALHGSTGSLKFRAAQLALTSTTADGLESGQVYAATNQAGLTYSHNSGGAPGGESNYFVADSAGARMGTNNFSPSASAEVRTDGGNVTITATGTIELAGTVTNNGAPIGSGGSGAVSSVAGKTGAVTLVKADVGLDNVDNTSDMNKPVSTATQAAIDSKVAPVSSVAGRTGAVTLTKSDVGLNNVDNTNDLAKPISTATQTALDNKADKSSTGPRHAEFTLSVSVPSGGPLAAYAGTFVGDANNTTGAAFATPAGSGRITLPLGVYAIYHYVDCQASMGTGAVVAIQDNATLTRYASLDVVPGSYNAGISHPCIYLRAVTIPTETSQTLIFSIAQFSGVARNANVRIYIEKIK